jgi:hypothetical protein
MVQADEPTQPGTPINKATLLSDPTCEALDIPTTSVPDDAFFILSIGNNRGLVVATVYETGTTTPIPHVVVSGILTATGGEVATNSNGVAIGYTTTTTTTVSVHAEYVDLNVTPQTISTPMNKKTTITLYASRKTNTGYLETAVTTSRCCRFTDRVIVDVDVLGGGYNGTTPTYGDYDTRYTNGRGGAGGKHAYALDKIPNPKMRYQAEIGAGGGGVSSFWGVSSAGGESTGEGGVGTITTIEHNTDNGKAENGGASTARKYGTGDIVGGGAGAGAAFNHYNRGTGGSPYGGDGETHDVGPGNGKGYGGGGSGARARNGTPGTPGYGYQGRIFFRWRYAV